MFLLPFITGNLEFESLNSSSSLTSVFVLFIGGLNKKKKVKRREIDTNDFVFVKILFQGLPVDCGSMGTHGSWGNLINRILRKYVTSGR